MNLRNPVLLACLLALAANAAGQGDPDANIPLRLVEASVHETVVPGDPRVAQTAERLSKVMKATGESEQAVAQACMRLARYIFDFSRQRVSSLDVLEALALHAPVGKPLNDTTQRYFDLRVKQKLDHAGALKQMAATR